jgi:uncharacterized protein (TIGR04255 family)
MAPQLEKMLPDFEKPPVTEVVCGVQFAPIASLSIPYLGILWEKFKLAYPKAREVAPLMPVIERFDDSLPEATDPFGGVFPAPRVWFETGDGNGLIQVQRDRFLHNWKKEREEDSYPHYDFVIDRFRSSLETFEGFLKENRFETISPTQYELTYVNHIEQGNTWKRLADIGEVFPDFKWRSLEGRFLPEPETINWQTSFTLPKRAGRLRMSIRLGKRRSDGFPVIVLELTARGIDANRSLSEMWSWFEMAHNWIVCGFTDLTSENMHKFWRRKR